MLEHSRQAIRKSGQSMASAEGFPAKTSAVRGKEPASKVKSQASGRNTSVSFARFARGSLQLKTSQRSLFGGLMSYSGTLTKSGSMRSGKLFRRPRLARHTKESEFSFWPTPVASDEKRMAFSKQAHQKQLARNQSRGFGTGPAGINLVAHVQIEFDGCPTANFVEWLMGFPIGWTDIVD